MRIVAVLALAALACPLFVSAQEPSIPPRFQSVGKGSPFKLTRLYGSPEMQLWSISAISADGKVAVYVEDQSGMIDNHATCRSRLYLWDTVKKGWPREIEVDGISVQAMSLAADGSKVLLGGWKEVKPANPKQAVLPKAYLSLWDLGLGKEQKGFAAGELPLLAIALSPDHRSALTTPGEGIDRWDLQTGKVVFSHGDRMMQKYPVGQIAWLPDGKQFVTNSPGVIADRWDVSKPQPVMNYPAKTKGLNPGQITVARDGKRFVSSDERSFTLWDIVGKEVGTMVPDKGAEEFVLGVALANDNRTVLAVLSKPEPGRGEAGFARLIAWDAEAKKTRWSHSVPYRGPVPMMVRGGDLLVGGGPNRFDVWNIADGKHLESIDGHRGPINAVALAANGDILSAGQEGMLFAWNKGRLDFHWAPHKGPITALALSRDRRSWLTAGASQSMRHNPPNNGRQVAIASGHKGPITSVAYASDAKWACSGSGDRTIKTWSLKDGSEIDVLTGHSEGVNAVAVSPDDRWIASASDDGTVRLWPVNAGKLDADRDGLVLEKHKKPVTCLAFSPDGKTLVSGSQDQTAIAWNWKKGTMDFLMPGHKNWITSLAFLDANTLLTTSDDLTLCAWDMTTGKEAGRLDFGIVGDCPRCVAATGPDRIVVGSSSWLLYEFQFAPMGKSKR